MCRLRLGLRTLRSIEAISGISVRTARCAGGWVRGGLGVLSVVLLLLLLLVKMLLLVILRLVLLILEVRLRLRLRLRMLFVIRRSLLKVCEGMLLPLLRRIVLVSLLVVRLVVLVVLVIN